MVEYKHVKWCKRCKEKFVVPKSQGRMFYCEKCQKRMEKEDDD